MSAIVSDLGDKVCLVTGGAQGIGAVQVAALAHAGAEVHVADVCVDAASRLVDRLVGEGLAAKAHELDVSDPAAWRRVLGVIAEAHGRLDVLVNNAGTTHRAAIAETDLADWDRVIDVNLDGPFLGIKFGAALMGPGGSIINIGSAVSLMAWHVASYAASKGGLRSLTKTAALEYAARGIRVNAVHPGLIETAMVLDNAEHVKAAVEATPMLRAGTAGEVADAVLFLASDASGYVTGVDLAVDGGMSLGSTATRMAHRTGVYGG